MLRLELNHVSKRGYWRPQGTSRFDIDLVGLEYSGFSTRVVNILGHELGWVLCKYFPLLAENENYTAYGVAGFGR